jgi:hypothetical protein
MYAGYDFDPSDAGENEYYGLDFSYDLAALYPGEYIISVIFYIGVVSGIDATPSTHLTGMPFVMVNPSTNTGVVTLAVQQVTALLPGVVYWLQAKVVTNAGNDLRLWSKVSCAAPPSVLWRGPCPI